MWAERCCTAAAAVCWWVQAGARVLHPLGKGIGSTPIRNLSCLAAWRCSQYYEEAKAGVAWSTSPTGPFQYVGSSRPNGQMSRDMTLFQVGECAHAACRPAAAAAVPPLLRPRTCSSAQSMRRAACCVRA